ncbi:MAG: siphovirus Gp157 family protein [Pseudomonadota bacterium]|nr:siphovirus Gp157 family protein [Pseudomonadota bacterium]
MNPAEIESELRHWNAIKAQLLAQGLDEDEQCLLDTLEGETDLRERLVALIEKAVEATLMVEKQKRRMADLTERKARYERRHDRLKEFALKVMEAAGLKSIEAPEFTFGTRPTPPKVQIISQRLLPEEFLRVKPPEPDLAAIGKALKNGEEVPGALLGNGGTTLQIRTR